MDSKVVEIDTFLCPWKSHLSRSKLFLKTHLFECERWCGERIQFLEDVGVGKTSWRSLFPRHFEILLPSWFQIPIKSSSSWSSSHYYIWNLLFKGFLTRENFMKVILLVIHLSPHWCIPCVEDSESQKLCID